MENTVRKLPPLHALRAFEAAARHLHFAKAADELGLTPTAISHQVRQLEEILGVDLFQRFPRPVKLTPAGQRLFPVLLEALDQIAAAIDQLSSQKREDPLRLSVTMAFASRWLMPRLPELRHKTGLTLAVEADDQVADLHSSGIDMAIRYSEQPGRTGEWHRLLADQIIAVASPDLISEPAPFSEQILTLPRLHYPWKSDSDHAPTWSRWEVLAGVEGQHTPVMQSFSEEIHAIDAALAGQGAVLASKYLVADLIEEGRLVQLSEIALPGLTYWAVFLTSNSDQDRLKQLLEWLKQAS